MRVLISRGLYGEHLGGAEIEIVDFGKLITQEGHTSYLITNSQELAHKYNLGESKVLKWPRHFNKIFRFFLAPVGFIRFYRQIFTHLGEIGADLVIPESKEDGILFSLTKKRHKLPVVWRDHADLRHHLKISRSNPFAIAYQRLLIRALNQADIIATVSQYDLEHIAKFITDPKKISVIHPGIVSNKKTQLSRRAKRDKVTIGIITRLVEDKGVQYLIKAVAKLKEPQVELLIIGDGPYRYELEEIAEKLKVRCVFKGYSSTPFKEYNNFDIFVQPSRYEGWSKTVIESMWHAVPVIASNIPSHSEQIDDGVTGLLFRSGDPSDLYEKLQRLVGDDKFRETLGKAGANSVRKFGDFKKIFRNQFWPLILQTIKKK